MSIEEAEDSAPMMSVDSQVNELLGLFDLPAFARRGQELEFTLNSMHARCRRQKEELLEMVRLRLRQWSRSAGTRSWSEFFAAPIDALWTLSGSEDHQWAPQPASARQRFVIARDLVASVERFNRRWRQFLGALNLQRINESIDQYNKYYVLEKECVMGSTRLASRHFVPVARITPQSLLIDYPMLPVPELLGSPGR
jgi:hypothetical protein